MNLRLDIEYDGSLYSGWQRQPNATSVQGEIEKALKTIFRLEIGIIGAGRTDAGVHAKDQVAHFKAEALPIPLHQIKRSLNGILKAGITIRNICQVDEEFHAMSKVKRSIDRNLFYLLPFPLDMEKLKKAAKRLEGEHDFINLSIATGEKSTICTIKKITIRETENEIYLTLTANRFLHKMVRMIVGMLIDIGRGKQDISVLDSIFAKRWKRKKGFAAPAHGLCLIKVDY